MSELLTRWSSRELMELQGLLLIEHYEALGMDVLDKDGRMKTLEALKDEEVQKDLQARAEAGLRKAGASSQ